MKEKFGVSSHYLRLHVQNIQLKMVDITYCIDGNFCVGKISPLQYMLTYCKSILRV